MIVQNIRFYTLKIKIISWYGIIKKKKTLFYFMLYGNLSLTVTTEVCL